MLRDNDQDAALLEYCKKIQSIAAQQSALGEPLRILLDTKPGKAAAKRWDWVRKGAPVIIEIGGRDMEAGKVSLLRRDRLWDDASGKPAFANPSRDECMAGLGPLLEDIHATLFEEARARREAAIARDIDNLDALAAFFAEDKQFPGWALVQWARPTGPALDAVVEKLKALKLTFRNVPQDSAPVSGTCLFTGEPAVEQIYVARAY